MSTPIEDLIPGKLYKRHIPTRVGVRTMKLEFGRDGLLLGYTEISSEPMMFLGMGEVQRWRGAPEAQSVPKFLIGEKVSFVCTIDENQTWLCSHELLPLEESPGR
jgi:hypothetical protein